MGEISRRPLAAAAAAYGAGIALQHIARGSLPRAVLALTAAILLCLIFYYIYYWQKIELATKNVINEEEEENKADTAAAQRQEGAPSGVSGALVRMSAVMILFMTIGACCGYLSENRKSQFDDVFDKNVVVSGVVRSVDIRDEEKCSAVIEVYAAVKGSENGSEQGQAVSIDSERIIVYVSNITGRSAAALTGRVVSVSGSIYAPDGASNPGTFDYSLYLLSKDIRAAMSADAKQLTVCREDAGAVNTLLHAIAVFKYDYEQRIISQIDDSCAQMLLGILFGDDSFMDEDMKTSFQQNGLAHLLAASGLHVGFVYGLFNVLMRKPSTVRGNLPVMAVLIIYAALAGFSASVIRAVFMIIVHIIGRVTHRRYDFLTCISFCALTLLIYEPMNLFSSGFQLSFAAVLTLSIVLKRVEQLMRGVYKAVGDRKGKMLRLIAEPVSGTVALQLGMLPLTVRSFHYISIAGFVLNPPAIALAGLIVPLGIILIPLAYTGGPAFVFAASMEEMLVKALLWLNSIPEGTCFSYRYAASPSTGTYIFYFLILLFLCTETGQSCIKAAGRFGRRAAAVPVLAAAVIAGGCGFAADCDYMLSDMIFVDVGQGDCAHLKGSGGTDILFDSGGSETRDIGADTLAPYLLANGVGNIDLAVISHLHTDHYGGLLTLKDIVEVKRLALSAVYESRAAEISGETGVPVENMIFLRAGDTVDAGGGVTLHVLAPAAGTPEEYRSILEDTEDENSLSLIVQAEYKGRRVLFTGDIDEEYEKKLTALYTEAGDGGENAENSQRTAEGNGLRSDILKIAHHGSKYSSCAEFLDAVEPSVCVIQVGRNLYGHPTPEALQRISDAGSLTFRNDLDGAVMIGLGSSIRIRTAKNG